MKTVSILTKSVYGVDRHYPFNREANLFAKLLSKKTFSDADLRIIEEMGYEIHYQRG